MTYVYVVKEDCEMGISGVFSTEKKAQDYIDSLPEDERNYFDIYKHELDKDVQ